MEREDRIQNFIDGCATGEECRELVKELRSEGTLGELLVSDAATLFFYSREELLEYFSPAEADEIEEMRIALTTPKKRKAYAIGDSAPSLRRVADGEEPYGE